MWEVQKSQTLTCLVFCYPKQSEKRKRQKSLPVKRQVQSHQFRELRIFVSELADKVGRPILVRINCSNACAVAEKIAIDDGCDRRQFSDQVH